MRRWQHPSRSTCPATPRPARWVPTRWPTPERAAARRGALDPAGTQRVARHALARAAGRGGDTDGRIGYGPVAASDVDGLVDAGLLDGAEHPLRLGRGRGVAWLRHAEPGHVRPGRRHRSAVARRLPAPTAASSGCARARDSPARRRRRGDRLRPARPRRAPASPPASSGRPCSRRTGDLKFVCCNADEGDSGTFADRMLMEGDPFTLIEGMTIAAYAVGATEGYVYIRSEYPDAVATLRAAIEIAYAEGWLGEHVLGSAARASTCTCGSARAPTSAARRPRCWRASRASAAVVRAKPPIPALDGLFGQADGGQQRAHARHGADDPGRRRAGVPGRSASAARAAPRSSSSAATSPAAASSRRRSASRSASWSTTTAAARDPAGRCGPSRSAARWGPTCPRPVRPADGLRGVRRGRRDGRPRRHRGVRRHRRHGRAGPVRDGVLRRGVVRQVHAVPDRRGARRRGDRPDHRRRGPRREPGSSSRTSAS